MLAEYHEEADEMSTVPERLRALEVELAEARKDQEDYRKESKHERRNMQMALEGQMARMEKDQKAELELIKADQARIKTDLTLITTFISQAKGIKWFIGFVTTTAAALSSIGIWKLFAPK